MASDPHDQNPPSERAFVLGAELFEEISAVEGIELSEPMRRRAREADRLRLSAEEQIERIKQAYLRD
ncbi:hypothetical protein [Rhodopseudomonas sp. B29]|uniref:hypothetical protein n=1 Tax=Rhodopseudomonas sp. B29 TaxID=95607 RepID=UPI0003B4F419|nr:hypothetical protein [Rhodopseudomonas sp. B29]